MLSVIWSMSTMRSRTIESHESRLTGPWSIQLHRSDQYEDDSLWYTSTYHWDRIPESDHKYHVGLILDDPTWICDIDQVMNILDVVPCHSILRPRSLCDRYAVNIRVWLEPNVIYDRVAITTMIGLGMSCMSDTKYGQGIYPSYYGMGRISV